RGGGGGRGGRGVGGGGEGGEGGEGGDGRVHREGQQRGGCTVRDQAEPVGQRRFEQRQALQPVPGQLDRRVVVPAEQQGAAEREHPEHDAGDRGRPGRQPPPAGDRGDREHHEQRPAEVAQVFGQRALIPR